MAVIYDKNEYDVTYEKEEKLYRFTHKNFKWSNVFAKDAWFKVDEELFDLPEESAKIEVKNTVLDNVHFKRTTVNDFKSEPIRVLIENNEVYRDTEFFLDNGSDVTIKDNLGECGIEGKVFASGKFDFIKNDNVRFEAEKYHDVRYLNFGELDISGCSSDAIKDSTVDYSCVGVRFTDMRPNKVKIKDCEFLFEHTSKSVYNRIAHIYSRSEPKGSASIVIENCKFDGCSLSSFSKDFFAKNVQLCKGSDITTTSKHGTVELENTKFGEYSMLRVQTNENTQAVVKNCNMGVMSNLKIVNFVGEIVLTDIADISCCGDRQNRSSRASCAEIETASPKVFINAVKSLSIIGEYNCNGFIVNGCDKFKLHLNDSADQRIAGYRGNVKIDINGCREAILKANPSKFFGNLEVNAFMAESINVNKMIAITQEASIKIIAEQYDKIESKELTVSGGVELKGNVKFNNSAVQGYSYVAVKNSQIENCFFETKSDKIEPIQVKDSLLSNVSFLNTSDRPADIVKIVDSEITESDIRGNANVNASILYDIRGEDIEAENTTYFGKDKTPLLGKLGDDLSDAPLKAVKKDPVVNVVVDKKKTNDIEL